MAMGENRLDRTIRFVLEIDKLKTVMRRSYLTDSSRRENSAEHSWQVAMMAMVLAEQANEKVDVSRVVKMLLVHDIVEIDAGDTYIYDQSGNRDKAEREERAANRIFGLLPTDVGSELRALWEEYEARTTAEAKFAYSLDRLMPLMCNYHTQGKSWQEHGITADQVRTATCGIADGSETLWSYARELIEDAVAKNYLAK
jgi:putative hydrolase of HD superfamily